jgi:predicted amidohydrolase
MSKDVLKIGLVQSDIIWHEIQGNLAMYEEKIWALDRDTDLIVLPEMFQTGFTMDTQLAEPQNLHTLKWLKQMAKQTAAVITGSYMVKENGKVYNRLVWMQPDGNYHTYDKSHLFRMSQEDRYFEEGVQRLIVEWKGWKICPLICYDLRFPVWSRNTDLAYDLLLYVANWPAVRISAWDALLKARAIENLSYAIGLNRVGVDGKGIAYDGHTSVFGPKGDCLLFSEKDEILQLELNKQELQRYRVKFPAHLDADDFNLESKTF